MGIVHAGLAKHGQAWFAKDQTAGKGQRGNTWLSHPGDNIILTVSLQPASVFTVDKFYFNACIALSTLKFLREYGGEDFFIKWPNDLYWRDRKAGGILIENVIQGQTWRWSVVGIGINVNQKDFPTRLLNPVSLSLITGQGYDAVELAMKLHEIILDDLASLTSPELILQAYNDNLYKKDQEVRLKKDNGYFLTTIKGVDAFGNLLTEDVMERSFTFGEVSWI